MANYNYVAPVQFTSYADMAKKETALAIERQALRAEQQRRTNTRQSKFIDRIENVNTNGWSDILRHEFLYWKKTTANQIASGQPVDYVGMSDMLMEFQSKGDQHAKVYLEGDGKYASYVDTPELYDKKLPYGVEAVFDYKSLESKRKRYHNVNLYNYNYQTMIGDFGNPDYDPFDEKSPKTLRELALSQGKQIQTKTQGPANLIGKDYYVNDQNQEVYISGSGFDSPDLGNLGVYNPTLKALDNILPIAAHAEYTTRRNRRHFVELANRLNKQIDEGDKTYDQAFATYVEDALEYIKPDGISAVKSFSNSALEQWEDATATDYKGDDKIPREILNEFGTPWEYYAKRMADTGLIDPQTGIGSEKLSSTDLRRLRQFKGKKIEQPSREFVRSIQDPQYDWETALINAETDEDREIIQKFVEKDSTTGKFEFKDDINFGEGASIRVGDRDVTYKGYYTNQVEVFQDFGKDGEGLVVIYAAGKVSPGESELPEEAGDARWMPLFADTARAPFMVINIYKPGTTDYTEEYEELLNSFDALPMKNALVTKINTVLPLPPQSKN